MALLVLHIILLRCPRRWRRRGCRLLRRRSRHLRGDRQDRGQPGHQRDLGLESPEGDVQSGAGASLRSLEKSNSVDLYRLKWNLKFWIVRRDNKVVR